MTDQSKLTALSDSSVADTIRSAGAARSFAKGGTVEPTQAQLEKGRRSRPLGSLRKIRANGSDQGMKVDRTYDDPYLAGMSQDHRRLYIDKRVPKKLTVKGKTFDPAKYLGVHEKTERKYMDAGMKYQPAHRLALKAERRAVEADGIEWNGYQAQMYKLASVTEHEASSRLHPPTDLYAGPFPASEKAVLKAHGDRDAEVKSFAEGGAVEDEPGPWDEYSAPEEHGSEEPRDEEGDQEAGPWDEYKRPEYSVPAEAAKRVAKSVLPGMGSLPAIVAGAHYGAQGGAALGSLVMPGPGTAVGGFLGGVGGAVAGGLAAGTSLRHLQDYFLDKLNMNADPEKEAAFQQEHPTMAAGADIAGSMVSMSPAPGIGLATRAIMGGGQAALEAGSEYLHTGEFDPQTIAMAAAAGAAFPGLNKVGQRLAGGLVAGRAQPGQPGRPDMKALPAPPDYTTSSEGETARYQPGDDQVFGEAAAPRKGTPNESTRPIYDEATPMYQKESGGPWEEYQPRSSNAAEMEPPVNDNVVDQSQPGTSPNDNLALPAPENPAAPDKTPEFIATSKKEAAPARNNGSSLATSHEQAPPPKNPGTVGSNPDHPLSVGGPRDYRKTADSNVSPDKSGAPGYPTATVGDPAQGNISPEVMQAITGKGPETPPASPNSGTEATPVPPERVSTGIPEATLTDTVTKLRNAGLDQVADRLEKEPEKAPQARRILADLTAQDYEGMPIDADKARTARRMLERANTPEDKAAAEKLFEEARNPLAKEQQERLANEQTQARATRRETEGQVAKVGEETVTAASQRKAALIKRAADAAQSAYDKFATGKIGASDYSDLGKRLRDAIEHANAENLDVDALAPMPRKRTPAQEWLKAARDLVGTKDNPKQVLPSKAVKFLGDERMLLNGAKAKEVGEMGRIEGDIANNRRRISQDVGDETTRNWLDSLPPEDREAWDKDFGGVAKDPGEFDTENWDMGSPAGKKPDIDYYDRAAKFWTDDKGAFDPKKFMQDFRGFFGPKNSGFAKRFSAREISSYRDNYAQSLSDALRTVQNMGNTRWLDGENYVSKNKAAIADNGEKIYLAAEKDDIASLSPEAKKAYYDTVHPVLEDNDYVRDQIEDLSPGLMGPKVESHIARIPQGLNPDLGGDPVAGVMESRRNGLKMSASQTMQREFMVIEDPKGNRTVVSETPEGYREWRGGKSLDMQNAGFENKAGTTFTAKDGTLMTVKDALTPEIEANARFKNGEMAKYYKNPLMSAVITNVELKNILSHLHYLESLKPELKAKQLATDDAKQAQAWQKPDEPWEKTLMPQMKDWYVTPRIREALDDFAAPGMFPGTTNGVMQALRNASNVVTKLLFVNPLFHIANVGTHWFTARGWDWLPGHGGYTRMIKGQSTELPGGKRQMALNAMDAIRSVLSQDSAVMNSPMAKVLGIDSAEYRRFQDALVEHNAGTQYRGVLNQNAWGNIARASGETIASNPSKWDPIARVVGMSAKDLGRAIYRNSSKVMWAANDIFYTQLVMERMQKGMTMADAIRDTEKHFPAYKVPTRVISGGNMGRWISQALRDNTLFAFGPYHYGVYNSYAHIVKDAVKGTGEERADAIGHMFALGILGLVVYPAWDEALKVITGNKNAEARRRGPMTLPEHIKRAFQAKEDLLNTGPSGAITLSPLISGTMDLYHNKDFAGRSIVEPGDVTKAMHGSARAAGRVAIQEGSAAAKAYLAPYSMVARALENKSGSALAGLRDQQLLDARTPSPAATKYEAQAAAIKRKAAEARERKGNRGFEENIYNKITR